jgi:hypothetical protein
MMTVDQMVRLAKAALKEGRTRGQFIREFTTEQDTKEAMQEWSDAYSIAMQEAQDEKAS